MTDNGDVNNSDGDQIGYAADLGTDALGHEWWAVATASTKDCGEMLIQQNMYNSTSMQIQATGSAKLCGTSSSVAVVGTGLTLSYTSPKVVTVDVIPSAKIELNLSNMGVTTNSVRIASLLDINMSDFEVRAKAADVTAFASIVKSVQANLDFTTTQLQTTASRIRM